MRNIIKTTAALVLCAAVIAVSGCSGSNAPTESTTTAQSLTTTTSAAATESAAETTASETTTTAGTTEAETTTEAVSEAAVTDSDPDIFPFRYGVWLATDGSYGSEYYDESYYCFDEDGSGSVLSQSMGIGVPFEYEQNGDDPTKWVFQMGAVDNFSNMEVIGHDGDTMQIKWDYSDDPLTLTYMGTKDEFSFYDNYSLGLMAQFLYSMGQYSVADTTVETAFEFDKISVIIRDPATDAILKWYFLDRYTATGYDTDGNDVDLTIFDGEWADMPYPVTFSSMPAIKELDTLRENGEMLGFWYLGYVEPYMDDYIDWYEMYHYIFEFTGMDYKVRYVNSFPSDSFVSTESGQELYLLLPSDIHGSITISELVLDEANAVLKEGSELYRQDDNLRPILLKCNRSEIMPDVLIRITDSNGELLEWSPFISGMTGSVVTENDTGKAIHDFTDYNKLMHPDNMPEAVG